MDPKGKRNAFSAQLMMTAIDAFLMAQCHVMEAKNALVKPCIHVTVKNEWEKMNVLRINSFLSRMVYCL